MARKKLAWNLPEAGNKGMISTKETEVEIKTGDKDNKKTLKGNVTTVGRVVQLSEFRTWAENVLNKDQKDDTKKISLTHEYLLQEFVNDNIVTNYKQYLRVKANPDLAVKQAIERLRTQFPKLSNEKLKAMAEMMLDSMSA